MSAKSPGRVTWLLSRADKFGKRYDETGIIDDLNRAIESTRLAVEATPRNDRDRAYWIASLAVLLMRRWKQSNDIDDLNRAIDVASMAVETTHTGPNGPSRLNNLRAWLDRQFEWTGMTFDHSSDHQAARLKFLMGLLLERYNRTGRIDDLNSAIKVADMGIEITPLDHPSRASELQSLSFWLNERYQQTHNMDDQNRSIKVLTTAVEITPYHPDRAQWLTRLGRHLHQRYEQKGIIDDLNRSIEVLTMAVRATPSTDPARAKWLQHLGHCHGARHECTGTIDDLNQSIKFYTMAVDATPLDHPDRRAYLNSFGISLGMRYLQTGTMDDLNYAIKIFDMILKSTPLNDPYRAYWLNNLGDMLCKRYIRTGLTDDLNQAIEVVNMALEALPPGHPKRGSPLGNLGQLYGMRYAQNNTTDDLDNAIELLDMAVHTSSLNNTNQTRQLHELGGWLGKRYEQTGILDDLNRSIEVLTKAVEATPLEHPARAFRLLSLSFQHSTRLISVAFRDDPSGKFYERASDQSLLLLRDAWNCNNRPSIRIVIAQAIARELSLEQNWEAAAGVLQGALKLLPTISPRSLENNDKQFMLRLCSGLASAAAATALTAGKPAHHALEFLELGRGVITSHLLEMRADISDLKREYPVLARKFEHLRDELDLPIDRSTEPVFAETTPVPLVTHFDRRNEAGQRFNDLIENIRAQPGFEMFLRPPTAQEMMAAADLGPIVILNVSEYRCDAFIIEYHQIRSLQLDQLSLEDVNRNVQQYRSVRPSIASPTHIMSLLGWLWDIAAGPVLEALGFTTKPPSDNDWPHMWWIPTGALSHLPLHAAGRYNTKRSSSETVLDRVVSSYSSSVKALIYGRRRNNLEKRLEATSDHALLVAMPETPSQPSLPFANNEVAMLTSLCESLQLTPIEPPRRQKKEVLEHLRTCKIFHFAGHGRSDSKTPAQSSLLLEDWRIDPLTVESLRDQKLQDNLPFLGYLSACSTGAPPSGQSKLIDEGIHLVGACQLAGFRHVVGTLWEVSDRHCVDVASILYKTLRDEGMTDIAVARGLHFAMRVMRDGDDVLRKMIRKNRVHSTTSVHQGDGNRHNALGSNQSQDTKAQLNMGKVIEMDDYTSCEERDAVLLDDDEGFEIGEGGGFYWVPYIHFGV